MTDTAGRLLRLLPLLTARPSWRGDELAARLGVTTRTVRRDIERLRELGYPVHAVPGRQGGYALGPGGARLPPLLLDEDSAVAVVLGLRAAAADPALHGSQEAAARAAAVIDQVLPARLRRQVEALTAATVTLKPAEPPVKPNDLALIALACQRGERLRLRYRNSSGQDGRRHVEPYRLVYTGRRWYLVAHDLDKGEWRSFRLDRMEDVRPTGARSRPADPPDAARFVSEGISSGPYRWRARVLLDAPAGVVAAMVPSTVAVVEAISEGECLLTSGSDSLDMIALHLAQLGVPFTPLEPPELRERCAVLADCLSQAATRYPAEESHPMIDLEITEGVAFITVNAPATRNALNNELAGQFVAACDEVDRDPGVGAAVIKGAGGTFCSGAERGHLDEVGRDPAEENRYAALGGIYRAFTRAGQLEMPTIAAVRGAAVGAGINLMLATDLRIVAEDARLISGFLRIGLHPGGGHFALLAGRAGAEAAAAAGLFGEEISGLRAVQLGLAWEALPSERVEERAAELARRVARDPQLARKAAASLRTELGPPRLPWGAALEVERGAQLWSLRRRAAP